MRCLRSEESTKHVFRDCPFANDVWTRLGIGWSLKQNQLQYKDWIQNIFERESNQRIRTIVCAIWALWTDRNKLLHERKMQTSANLTHFIIDYLRELDGVNKRLPISKLVNESWRPPEDINVKINFDAAFDKQHKRSCTVIVIRNSSGQVLKTKVHNNRHIPSTFAAEALVCVQAVRFGAESGFLRVEVEGDKLSVIKKILCEDDDRSEIRSYILDAKRLKSNFINCRFKHEGRRMNRIAHILVKEGLSDEGNAYLVNGLSKYAA
ncbi:hypothetical protein PVK06_028112 [Gossypium arboreum]|uniref:RNase H type-1 domain-containing protein n=1 Tax=Gossypium arboreum TaxID=29729 RepID=A0ABR0P215_GOSAR|nr:hypothetical protein PVK06_028112 [Gossypium arboreum]